MADTNYNDGKWHGWNGGECPVHPKSEVEVVYRNRENVVRAETRSAGIHAWDIPTTFAFRVVKEHKEPREWWLRLDQNGHICGTDKVQGDPPPNWDKSRTIMVREVLK